MSWKDSYIAKHGKEGYAGKLKKRREWGAALPGGEKERSRDRRVADPEAFKEAVARFHQKHPEVRIKNNREGSRKTGIYYKKKQRYKLTGVQGEKNRIRSKHAREWRDYKKIIAPDSQIHHEWIPKTSEYNGVALVETDQHMHGVIDVIKILYGKISLLTEKEIRAHLRGTE